jgi:ADP-ribose pyrophosphatase YjhB (NUDIX family)
MWLPPGGHIDRDELPHMAALREAHEETGLDVELVVEDDLMRSETAQSLPEPRHLLLEDINVNDAGQIGHQHIDFVFYGKATSRTIAPAGDDEADPTLWEWFTPKQLRSRAEELPEDVIEAGLAAIDVVDTSI